MKKNNFMTYRGLLLIIGWLFLSGSKLMALTALSQAVMDGNYEIAKLILEGEKDNVELAVNQRDLRHINLYKNFISYRSRDEVKLLLEEVFNNYNVQNLNGWTPLNWAVFNDDLPMVKLLLDHRANPNRLDSIRATPLHWAALWSKPEIIKELIDRGGNVTLRDDEGYTPLLRSLQREPADRDLNLVKMFIYLKAKVTREDKQGRNSFLIAVANDYEEAMVYLHSLNRSLVASRDNHGNTALHWAATIKNTPKVVNMIYKLVAMGVKGNVWNRDGFTAFHVAVYRRNLPVVKYYLDNRIDPNLQSRNGDTGIHLAGRWGHEDVIRLFLNSRENKKVNLRIKNKKGYPALNVALYNNHAPAAKEMLRFQNINPLDYDSKKETGLHLGARSGNLELMDALLIKARQISDQSLFSLENAERRTPLEVATWNGDVDMVIFMIKKGALEYATLPSKEIDPMVVNRILGNSRTVEMQRLTLRLRKDPASFPKD